MHIPTLLRMVKTPATSLIGEQRHSAMRYLFTLFFTLSFLTLSLSLKTEQVEVLKNISIYSSPYELKFSWDLQSAPCQWIGVSCSENGGDDVVGLDLSSFYINSTRIWRYVCQLPALQLLDLSYNSLFRSIPKCVGSFANLTILRLSSTGFSESAHLFSLSNLQVLDLSNNQLKGFIPPQLCSLSNLQVLDLSNNELTGFIPPQLLSLSNLENVNLSFNHLFGEIPPNFSSNLFRLSMEDNKLRGTIPSAISNARNLTHLVMSNNLLAGPIPWQLGSCTQLKWLWLAGNQLSGPLNHVLPKLLQLTNLSLSYNMFEGSILHELSNLSNLTYVDLSGNLLSGNISSKIFNLQHLTTLYLQENYLTGIIPLNIQNGKLLQELRLDRNNFTGTIPSGIGNLPLLGKFSDGVLDLSHNSLTGKIPITLCNLRFIYSLDFSNNMLTGEIPEALGNMTQLFELDLSKNKLIGEIPVALGNMSRFYRLDLSNNKLTGEIPEALGNMTQLFELDLSINKLTGEIPEALENMNYLHWLDLSNNKLTGKIPEALGNMTQLFKLNVSNNKLTSEIPQALGNMSWLYLLDLSNNKLTSEIPEALGNMTQLFHLNLSNNKLTGEIPEALGNMTNLFELDLSINKLTGEIPEALENMNYLDWLDLSNNKLTGKIPESLKRIGRIGYLNLTNNELVYSIPMRTGRSHSTFKILGAVGAVALFTICCLVLGVLWKRNLQSRAEFKQTIRKILEKVEHPRISHEELLAATNRFHNSNLLSTNSFGSVYKGFLPDGTRVAVKVLNLMHEQSEKIFRAECRVLQKARHRNLARIITTCSTPHFKALVFEYISNGSLEKHLYLHSCRLGLRKLLNIAIDVAHALEYLHFDCFVQIVHCDIKPSNILLDETMAAHLSDYGISRLMGRIAANSVTSTIDLKGSVGYIAPEYGLNGMISPRGDVYGYGILLLEMLTRRQPTDNIFEGDLNLHNWVKRAFPDRAFEVIDKSLLMERAGKETEECLISLVRLGLLCSSDSPEARPSMREVSNLLKLIQQDFTTDASSSIKLMPTISNLVCDRGTITNCEEASDTQSSSF